MKSLGWETRDRASFLGELWWHEMTLLLSGIAVQRTIHLKRNKAPESSWQLPPLFPGRCDGRCEPPRSAEGLPAFHGGLVVRMCGDRPGRRSFQTEVSDLLCEAQVKLTPGQQKKVYKVRRCCPLWWEEEDVLTPYTFQYANIHFTFMQRQKAVIQMETIEGFSPTRGLSPNITCNLVPWK